ncbi:MAG TPA: cellulase family glycosylhydrolase [Methanocella sp.]|nr:cellulase family glycosylhydrolase [Methanocella sp.]
MKRKTVLKFYVLALLAVFLVLVVLPAYPTEKAGEHRGPGVASGTPARAVSPDRFSRLLRGVNIFHWFYYPYDDTPAYFESYVTDQELRQLASMGIGYVRLSVDLDLLGGARDPQALDRAVLSCLDDAIARINRQGLAVIVNVVAGADLQNRSTNGFERFWETFARHLNGTDPGMVFLEVMNEPIYQGDPGQWAPAQERLIRVIRANAPAHTIIASGPLWSGIDGLRYIGAAADKNVVYAFHFYEPVTFTFQGAAWAGDAFPFLKDVPYPATVDGCRRALEETTDPTAKAWIEDYARSSWSQDSIDARIAQAYEWARDNGVPIIADEIGASDQAPREDRLRWFADVRAALEKFDTGWAVWAYDDPMGLDRKAGAGGTTTFDRGVAAALGLNV